MNHDVLPFFQDLYWFIMMPVRTRMRKSKPDFCLYFIFLFLTVLISFQNDEEVFVGKPFLASWLYWNSGPLIPTHEGTRMNE